jgi:hypothetical protein
MEGSLSQRERENRYSLWDKAGVFGVCSDRIQGSLSQRERAGGEGEVQADSTCFTKLACGSGFLRLPAARRAIPTVPAFRTLKPTEARAPKHHRP